MVKVFEILEAYHFECRDGEYTRLTAPVDANNSQTVASHEARLGHARNMLYMPSLPSCVERFAHARQNFDANNVHRDSVGKLTDGKITVLPSVGSSAVHVDLRVTSAGGTPIASRGVMPIFNLNFGYVCLMTRAPQIVA